MLSRDTGCKREKQECGRDKIERALCKKKESSISIYTDSATAMAWVRNKKAKTKLELTKHNQILFELIERAERWLLSNTYSNKILKWDTAKWGEIPADYGRKG